MKSPDEDDWGKLKRVMNFLNGRVENLGILKWYVNESHNVHWDCKGHGGAMFTMGKGKGAISSYSRKVKLNTRSSTETKLVVADMYMPEMLWSLYFMVIYGKSRIRSRVNRITSGQYKHAFSDEEQVVLEWKENQTHSSKALLYQIQNR